MSDNKPASITIDLPDLGEVIDYILVARVITEDQTMISVRCSDNLTAYDRVGMLEYAKFYKIEDGGDDDE